MAFPFNRTHLLCTSHCLLLTHYLATKQVPLGQLGGLTAVDASMLSGIVTGIGRRVRRAPVQYEAEPAPAPRVAHQLAEAKRCAGSDGLTT